MTNGAQYHLVLKLNELAENNGFVVKRNYQGHCESALMLCNKKDKFPHYVADSEFVIGKSKIYTIGLPDGKRHCSIQNYWD